MLLACEKQNNMRNYLYMGRHRNVNCFYLCIPKYLICDNTNLIVIFKQDAINLKHIFNEHVGSDMPFTDKYGFLIICKDNEIANGRYRK